MDQQKEFDARLDGLNADKAISQTDKKLTYELHDPRYEASYSFKSADEVQAKCAEIGSSRYSVVSSEGERTNFVKHDDQWKTEAEVKAAQAAAKANQLDGLTPEHNPKPAAELSAEEVAFLAKARADMGMPADVSGDKEENFAHAKKIEPDADPELSNQLEVGEFAAAAPATGTYPVPAPIQARYIERDGKFYNQGETEKEVFVDKGSRLETKENTRHVAADLALIAESRGWSTIKVSGTDDFRRETWIEATRRGLNVQGYEPSAQDLEERSKRSTQSEKAKAFESGQMNDVVKKYPDLAKAYAAQEAISKKITADGLNPDQAAVVANRVKQNFVNSIERGQIPSTGIKEVTTDRKLETEREVTR